ncbi:hypothetical protein NV379_20920 [Paenibacillus sp. N1-5-1-14]|uniref:hypothetical protein n=1 Tax=Paenibacillus radicibacter TaxID=2972488 RepID=UPI002158D214|nr:hypothetical protein [Paenibacillus radicibacter]MCR8645122.1 hypothetical protein [Paenibacillus radicibacter]
MSESKRIWSRIHMVVEILILIGFALSMIPFVYVWSANWVIPLVFVSAILSFILSNGTILTTIINIAMAFLGFIPLLGYVPRIIGIIISIINLSIIGKRSSR